MQRPNNGGRIEFRDRMNLENVRRIGRLERLQQRLPLNLPSVPAVFAPDSPYSRQRNWIARAFSFMNRGHGTFLRSRIHNFGHNRQPDLFCAARGVQIAVLLWRVRMGMRLVDDE